jgi:hypothetical protein
MCWDNRARGSCPITEYLQGELSIRRRRNPDRLDSESLEYNDPIGEGIQLCDQISWGEWHFKRRAADSVFFLFSVRLLRFLSALPGSIRGSYIVPVFVGFFHSELKIRQHALMRKRFSRILDTQR